MTNPPDSRAAAALPPALEGRLVAIEGPAGRLSFYVGENRAGIAAALDQTPLLLLHSINASGSAYEVRPIFEHCRGRRPVYAVDLPGFGQSDRSDRPYLPRTMTDAVHAVADEIRRTHGPAPIDLMGVSLSSEYVARAASESPDRYRSVALVSPTGFDRRAPFDGPDGATRGLEWLRRLLMNPRWSDGIYRNLTRPSVIRFFLKKTWGSSDIDEGLLAYDVLTCRQPGAKHAPLWFVSAFLFSADISRVYRSLQMPVWLVHGVRGDFVDYRHKAAYSDRPLWLFDVMPTGALPYFEDGADFMARYERFLRSRFA